MIPQADACGQAEKLGGQKDHAEEDVGKGRKKMWPDRRTWARRMMRRREGGELERGDTGEGRRRMLVQEEDAGGQEEELGEGKEGVDKGRRRTRTRGNRRGQEEDVGEDDAGRRQGREGRVQGSEEDAGEKEAGAQAEELGGQEEQVGSAEQSKYHRKINWLFSTCRNYGCMNVDGQCQALYCPFVMKIHQKSLILPDHRLLGLKLQLRVRQLQLCKQEVVGLSRC